MSKVLDLVTAESILQWVIIFVVVVFVLYKEFPEFYRRITKGAKKEQKMEYDAEEVNRRLDEIDKRLDNIDGKLANDYESLRKLAKDESRHRRMLRDSLEEREIIMRALLGIIGGLQEMGADGPTQEAQTEITSYLAKQAHKEDIEED